MSATHEIAARQEVPTTTDHLVSAFDYAHGTLDKQLGSTVRLRKRKTKANPTIRQVPNYNGFLNVVKLVKDSNDTLERNGMRMEKFEIGKSDDGTTVAGAAPREGPCIQQCLCTLHVKEDDIVAAAKEIEKRRQQATRSGNSGVELEAKILTDDRSRSIAASSEHVLLRTSTTSSVDELRLSTAASAATAGSTIPVHEPHLRPAQAAAVNLDPIPPSMPRGLPDGEGTIAEKVVYMFEEEFAIGGFRYPPILEWTSAKRSAAQFKDAGTFKKRCIQYLGARHGCDTSPVENQRKLNELEKLGMDYTNDEREERRGQGKLTQSCWHDKCRELHASKPAAS